MIAILVSLTVKQEDDAAKVASLLAEAARLSRSEPGCERFDVYQSESDKRRFVLCEHWSSAEAHETHRGAKAYTTIYQPQVLPLVDRESQRCGLLT